MKVILLKSGNLGTQSSVVEVSDGYARNFLIPRGLAQVATPPALRALEKRKKLEERKLEKEREGMQELAGKLAQHEVILQAEAGEGGKLHGSITTSDIAQEIKAALGLEIDKKKIILEEPIRLLGTYTISLKLFPEIETTLKVQVLPKE